MYRIESSFPEEVIALKEAKAFLKVSYSQDDDLIKNCIVAALETAENFLNCCLYMRNIELVREVTQQEVKMPIDPIKQIRTITIIGINRNIKDLCRISKDKKSILLPPEIKGQVAFVYQTESSPLASQLKHILMSHMEALYEKHILSQEEQNQILNLYKPYRKILI